MSYSSTFVHMWRHFKLFQRFCVNNKSRKFCSVTSQRDKISKNLKSIQRLNLYEDPHYQDLKIELFPQTHDSEDIVLQSIVESTSMQQVFDYITNLLNTNQLTVKYSSQALATLWDLQMYLFQVDRFFDSSAYFSNRKQYIAEAREQPIFQNIVEHVVRNCEDLDDLPLAASLQSLIRFNYEIREPNCQKLLNELLKRKDTLSLNALSRLCISVNKESYYGVFIMLDFLPLLYKYIDSMNSDMDVKLASVSFLNAHHGFPVSLVQKYRQRLNDILKENTIELSVSTLTKIILNLYETQFVACTPEENPNVSLELIRQFCYKLLPFIPEFSVFQCLSMSRFLEFQKQPYNVIEKLSQRIAEHFELNPSVELMGCLSPVTNDQRTKMATYIDEYMDTCSDFARVAGSIYRVLKRIHCNSKVDDKFWNKISQLITSADKSIKYVDSDVDIDNLLFEDYEKPSKFDDDIDDANTSRRRMLSILRFTHQYTIFCFGKRNLYRNLEFESVATKEIVNFLSDYDKGKMILTPSEYAKCVSYLISTNYRDLQLNPSFLRNFSCRDLVVVSKSLKSSHSRWYGITRDLSRRCEVILRENPHLHPWEYAAIARVDSDFQRSFGSPLFIQCFNKLVQSSWIHWRGAREMLALTLSTGYYDPQSLNDISNYICENEDEIHFKLVEAFVCAGYMCATDYLEGYSTAARILQRNLEKMHSSLNILQSMLGLLYHGSLQVDVVNKVFSVDFLDQVDSEVKSENVGYKTANKIRYVFMELNRAVCLDLPAANIPWFHEKYCEELVATAGNRENYLQREVSSVLEKVVGGSKYVSKKVYSPYFYLMDFLLQFDHLGRPMTATKVPSQTAATKVAVIVQRPQDFTSNVRQLKGVERMKTRHLEMLGYRVINIDPTVWNSMHMSETEAKNNYLRSSIFSK